MAAETGCSPLCDEASKVTPDFKPAKSNGWSAPMGIREGRKREGKEGREEERGWRGRKG